MSRINNYAELVAERVRLEKQLVQNKAVLKAELQEVKVRLEPFTDFISFLGIFKKREASNGSLLRSGMSVGVDLLGGKFLSVTHWISRLVLPVIMKGIVNRILTKRK